MKGRGGWGAGELSTWLIFWAERKREGHKPGSPKSLSKVQKLAIRTRFSHKASLTGQFGVVEPRKNQSPSLSGSQILVLKI